MCTSIFFGALCPTGLKKNTNFATKTVEDQPAILAKWVKDIVRQMGCTCREAGEVFDGSTG